MVPEEVEQDDSERVNVGLEAIGSPRSLRQVLALMALQLFGRSEPKRADTRRKLLERS